MTSVLKILHQIILFKGIKNILYIFQWKCFHWTVFQVSHYLKANVHVKKLQWNFTGNQGSNSDLLSNIYELCVPRCQIWSEKSTKKSGKVWTFQMENV